MNKAIPLAEDFSRAAKALIDGGAASTFEAATQILEQACPSIVAGPDAMAHAHQAALLTSVETTVRAFGHALVHLPPEVAAADCSLSGHNHSTVRDAVTEAGGELVELDETLATSAPTIIIGKATVSREMTLQVTWDQWFAHVDVDGLRLPERGNMILAAVAAAALAVTECFKRALGQLEACRRNRSLNLWRPELNDYPWEMASPRDELIGPSLRHLPQAVWLVGLGHLGQGYAWCWRLLPYADPSQCRIQLQDFDRVNHANRSTGMFVRDGDERRMKTRVISEALEGAGFITRIVERRLLPETRRDSTEPALALIGVDKVEPRRLISDVGWSFAVDVGLGGGPTDFTGINVHTFPAPTSSNNVAAWNAPRTSQRAARAREQKAYRSAQADGADACGLVQLAETSVAAPFVGVVAACLAVAEPLRALHGHHPHLTLAFDAGRTRPPRSTTGDETPRIAFVPAQASSNPQSLTSTP
jgi:hypothetical protein